MRKAFFWSFIALLLCYIILSFSLPVDPEVLKNYEITQTEARLLNLTIVVPISVIYLVALFGFLRVNDYAEKIHKTKEGPYFKDVANGLMVLAFSLPILSITGSLLSFVRYRNHDLLPTVSIMRGYLALAFALISILLIAKGARGLQATLKNKKISLNTSYILVVPIILASIYTWLITSQTPRANSDQGYFMPDWLVIATLAIPYTFLWSMGIIAAFHLYKYKNGVKGIIYKRAFDNLSKGVGFIIVISIFIQFITTLSEQLSRLNLTPLLLIIYLLILLYAIGFGLVARGSKKLKKIEEA